jgi:hypothetical protein
VKDFPRYTSIKYYYSDKKTSDTFLFGESAKKKNIKGDLIATLVLTEDGIFYLNLHRGTILTPDSYRDDRCVPMEWVTQRAIKYAIDYQPYDFEEVWTMGHSMYSKEFWHLTYNDIRDFKIKISLNEFHPTGEWWG